MKTKFTSHKIATLAILCACALIVFCIESLLPSIIIPGAKMGLSNVFTMLALVMLGGCEATILVIVKSVLGCLIVGNIGALIYSLTAGLVAVCISALMFSFLKKVSLCAISVASAVAHNTIQTLVFCIVANNVAMLVYLPYFVILGIISGLSVGLITILIFKRTPESLFFKIVEGKKKEDKIETEKR